MGTNLSVYVTLRANRYDKNDIYVMLVWRGLSCVRWVVLTALNEKNLSDRAQHALLDTVLGPHV